MKTIGFDLTFISSNNLVGSSKFVQRLLIQIMKREAPFNVILYLQKHIDPSIFGIEEGRTGVEIVFVPTLKGRFQRILFQQTLFYRYLKKCDVMYGFCTYLPLFCKSKKIITLHDMLPFAFTKKHSLFRRLFIIEFTKFIARKVNHIVTVSNNSKQDILKYIGKKDDDVTIISNFILDNESVIKNRKSKDGIIRTSNGTIMLKKPYICSISSLQPGKNLVGLIKAFEFFHKDYTDYHLYLCGGKGWGYHQLFDLVNEQDMSSFVHFTGYLADEELDKVYSECEAVAYVSFFEGFGIPPLEGFLHNKVCVVSNTTSLPEVAGDAGVYVDPYDTNSIARGLAEVITHKEKYEIHIAEQIRKFSPEKETDKFIKLLLSI